MTNSWRALARMARDRIVQADPEDLPLVLNLWSLRLSSLARLRLFNQVSAEATNLFGALASITPPAARTQVLENVLPFELDVIHARMWTERGARVGLIAASQFIEAKDYAAAAALLEPLAAQDAPAPELRAALGRVYLQAGQLAPAEAHFAAVAADAGVPESTKALNAALVACARGEWARASAVLREIVAQDGSDHAAVNNLAVALLAEGRLKEGIEVLEAALEASPAALAMAEPFLFNLSTLYELRSSIAADKKRELLIEVAKWSGDGLRTTCLKMPG
ncbi:hypothetical protein BC834DRAFT_921940 [Gloeopeniophorella convolvens]|nr:hypothetical protein BC834DRAFT_921940 [Gloeopeniophorella convolvens]